MNPARREHYQAKFVFLLFLASLGMFFLGSIITYLTIRDQAFNPIPDAVPGSILDKGPEIYAPLTIPISFWISTIALIFVSYFLQRACWTIHREKQAEFKRWLFLSWVSALAFTFIQGFGLSYLLTQHFSAPDGSMKVFRLRYVPSAPQPLRPRTSLRSRQLRQLLALSGRRLGVHVGRVPNRKVAPTATQH